LIKGGTVVNAHHQQVADVYIEDGIIVSVNPTITVFLFPIDLIQCSL
jgi:dihydropyrimidinase